jgi:hypothetical protein
MPITSADVKLVKSQVMLDVPEGGGAPSGNVIVDGTSNAIFPDISELDRAAGRVNLRKVFATIQTNDTDSYYGANMIVAEPPADPRVSVTLFSTESTFDERTAAASRIESYLSVGAEWAGYLYENHLAGQRVVQFFQRTTATLPNVGQTLVLVENEGLSTQKTQYIRATAVSSQNRTFTYLSGSAPVDYTAAVVTVSLSDALRTDFTGSPASNTFTRATNGTKVRDTVVADAGTYVGVVPLTDAASIGDFTVSSESIFTQLVPSAQSETPINDVRTNGLSTPLVATGAAITRNLTLGFTTTQNMFVGGPIYPGSLSVARSGVTITDSGGTLINGSTQVGTVDYDNGILTLTTSVWGSSAGTHTVTFTPAALPDLISSQRAIKISIENRSLSYALTLEPGPLPRTLQISFRSQGNWYVLRDNGAGVIRGTDSAYGAGTINYTTYSVLITLGALPDVGSTVLFQWYSDLEAFRPSNSNLVNDGKFYTYINTSGVASGERGARLIKPGTLTVNWTDNGVAKSATESGNSLLTGDATGTVDYSNGVVRISPNTLPAVGTVYTLSLQAPPVSSVPTTPVATVNFAGGSIGASNISPGSFTAEVDLSVAYDATSFKEINGVVTYYNNPSTLYNTFYSQTIKDDGQGNLKATVPTTLEVVTIGTINYTTGVITIDSSGVTLSSAADPLGVTFSYFYENTTGTATLQGYKGVKWTDSRLQNKSRKLVPRNYTSTQGSNPFQVRGAFYSTVSTPEADIITATVNQYQASAAMVPNYALRGVSFSLGSTEYSQLTDGTLRYNVSPTTGVGTPTGNVAAVTGNIFLSFWPAGTPSTVSNWRGVLAPPTEIATSPFTATSSVFRIAATPVRPGSFSVLGTMQDGTQFNVTAGVDGKINGARVKGLVDYEYGLVELYFVNPAGDPLLSLNLASLGISGLTTIPADLANTASIRYNAVAYSYLPLDADIIGIDPVRLPTDGRVPIFRQGSFAVVGHTGTVGPVTVSNAQVINCGRVRLSRVRVIGNNGQVITSGYTADLEAGTVVFNNVSGYSQPVRIEHRIEDMALVSDAQINGDLTFTRALTHNYPLGSYVSSALVAGDLQARVSILFDQATWSSVWANVVSGGSATATFNDAINPIVVTNKGAITERWALIFTNSTSFNVIGENVGVIATGNTGSNLSPLNPATGAPYFTVPAAGWGLGWSAGNVLRFNTIGAEFPVWVVRTILQGPETVVNDDFTLLIRGDVDQP